MSRPGRGPDPQGGGPQQRDPQQEDLQHWGHRTLEGTRVVVTRPGNRGQALAETLRDLGAEAPHLPLLAYRPPPDPELLRAAVETLRTPGHFSALAFTSPAAVEAFFELWGAAPPSPGLVIGAVGPATADALHRRRWTTPILPPGDSTASGAALAETLLPHLQRGGRVLFPRAEEARHELPEALRAGGAEVVEVVAYITSLPAEARHRGHEIFGQGPLGWVTVTSPRIAQHLAELFGDDWARRRGGLRALSIGPTTSAALRQLGVDKIFEAAQPSDRELIRPLLPAAR
ncbi:MAG: uroporphyrinogen-III synthase [Acidobacteriota bacterium]